MSEWFNVETGVYEGCLLSTLLVSINDLEHIIKGLNASICVDGKTVSILLYRDHNIILLRDAEAKLHKIWMH